MHRWYDNGVKFYVEVEKNMRNMKSRIAAMLLAATATVSAAQAIAASASETFYYTTNTVNYCQDPYNMGQFIKGASRYNNISAGATWNKTITSGAVCGESYRRTTYSGNNTGTPLTGSQGLARELAESFFGTKTFMEKIIYGSTAIEPGDQIRIGTTRNGSQKTLFVAYVNGLKFDTYSLNNTTKKIERTTYKKKSSTSYYLQRLNASGTVVEDNIYMDFLIRPVKKYDINGDGTVNISDKQWLDNKIGDQYNYPKDINALLNSSNYRTDIFARVVQGTDYYVPYSCYYALGFELLHGDPTLFNYVRYTAQG